MVEELIGTALIGNMAGIVWQYLHDSGPVSLNKLCKEVDAPKDLLMQAIGWLAREDKIFLEKEKRTITIGLR